ncbi:MAG TPA: hypothetical protein VH592_25555 [Gemmataceae bacterium]
MRAEAEQLARLLRSGLEFRWPVPPPASWPGPFPPGGSVRAFLTPSADTLNHRLPTRSKPWHRVIRWARYVVRAVITPWLRVQSHFNFAAVSVIEQLEQRIRALEEAERALRQTIEDREKMLRENP